MSDDEDKVEKMRKKLDEMTAAFEAGDHDRVNEILEDFEYHDTDDGIGVLKLRENG